MKRILTLLLVLALTLATFASCEYVDQVKDMIGLGGEDTHEHNFVDGKCEQCGEADPNYQPPEEEHTHNYVDGECECGEVDPEYDELTQASAYIHQLYKNDPVTTTADLTLVSKVAIGTTMFPVVWTVSDDRISVVVSEDGESVTIDIPEITEDSYEDIPFTLTATVTSVNGYTASRSYERNVPKFQVNTWEDYAKAEAGDPLMVEGIVVLINSKSAGNTRNNLFVMDASGVGGYYNYQMTLDPIADLGIQVGMTVRISGEASPYNGLPEFKDASVKIIDETIKTFDFIDITEKFQKGTDFNMLVALPVVLKDVVIGGQELETSSSQYLYFEVNGVESYVRTYVTDFPAGILNKNDKTTIDEFHAANYGNTADVYGIMITYSGNPYLIPVSVDCFTNIRMPERSDAEKLELELGAINFVESVGKDTTLELPLTGSVYDAVKFTWTVDDSTITIGEDGKVAIALGSAEKTLTFTVTATVGEVEQTKTYTVTVASSFVMNTTAPYIPYIYQGSNGYGLYLDGGVSGRYLTTTQDASKAVKVYAEKAEGGYKLYIFVEDAKQYILVYNNDEGKSSVKYDAEGSVFSYNSVVNAFVTTLGTSEVYLGTYKTFDTISVSNLSYINAENTGVSQFPLELLKVVDGDEYTGSVNQVTNGYVVYLDGGVSGRYLTTTQDASKAVKVYAEKAEGGYKLYIFVEDAKQYILVYNNDEGKSSVKYDAEGSVFSYNSVVNAFVTTLGTSEVYLGTYKTFDTISVSNLSYINAENTGVSQFPLVFDAYVANETPVVPHEHVFVDGKCECGETDPNYVPETPVVPDDGVYTIPEVLAAAEGTAVIVKGTVSEFYYAWDDNYGNCSVYIVDDAGNKLLAFRLATKVALGDQVTITGTVTAYNGVNQLAQGCTAVIDVPAGSEAPEEQVTIAEAITLADGTAVTVSGVVISADTWSTQYNNMSVTIKDANGDTLYIYRLSTQVGLGDTITVTGAMATYNDNRQIGQGATAVIDVVHGDNHTYVDGACSVCGTKEPVVGETTVKCDFSTLSAGTQYADESNTFGEVTVSTHNKGCHFNTQLRIYDSSSNDGWAIVTAGKTISGLKINMGYKVATLNVYGSVDGETWVLIEGVATTSTSYLDYTVNVDSAAGYKYLKLDASGAQIRVASIELSYQG